MYVVKHIAGEGPQPEPRSNVSNAWVERGDRSGEGSRAERGKKEKGMGM
jgi:ribosomal protein L15